MKRKDLFKKWNGKTYCSIAAIQAALKINSELLDIKRKPKYII